jgi:hypothetical protein
MCQQRPFEPGQALIRSTLRTGNDVWSSDRKCAEFYMSATGITCAEGARAVRVGFEWLTRTLPSRSARG